MTKANAEQRKRYRNGLRRLERMWADIELRLRPTSVLRADRDRE